MSEPRVQPGMNVQARRPARSRTRVTSQSINSKRHIAHCISSQAGARASLRHPLAVVRPIPLFRATSDRIGGKNGTKKHCMLGVCTSGAIASCTSCMAGSTPFPCVPVAAPPPSCQVIKAHRGWRSHSSRPRCPIVCCCWGSRGLLPRGHLVTAMPLAVRLDAAEIAAGRRL